MEFRFPYVHPLTPASGGHRFYLRLMLSQKNKREAPKPFFLQAKERFLTNVLINYYLRSGKIKCLFVRCCLIYHCL
jgi:hypothetical protein